MRRFSFLVLILFIFSFLFLNTAKITRAAGLIPDTFKFPTDYLKEFCDKRSGDLMNLETWYSGKCDPAVDTVSGDGVGFSDIVLLQGIEYFTGPVYDSFPDMVIKLVKGLECLTNPTTCSVTTEIPYNNGFITDITKITGFFLTAKPATTTDYLAYVSSNLHKNQIVNETFAAGPGYGFTALSPILPLWRAFRNVAYLLFALGFVVYGIMIMFRVRIDPKTAATIQLAIPKLVFTLILITFSYAIVGLLIDISTLITALLINVLKVGGILKLTSFSPLPMAAGGQYGAIVSTIVNSIISSIVAPLIFFNLIGGIIGAVMIAAFNAATLGIPSLICLIILFFSVAFTMIKLTLKLFEAFFTVIVSLIFSPIILLGNLQPGSTTLSTWFMGLIANLAVFPTASFFLVLSYALMVQPLLSISNIIPSIVPVSGILSNILGVEQFSTFSTIWTPPLTIPGNIAADGSIILATIGFGFLLMASKYVDMVKDALKVPPFKYGTAIGEALEFPGKLAKVGADTVGKVLDKIPKIP